MTEQDEPLSGDDGSVTEDLKDSGWTRLRRWLQILSVVALFILIARIGGDALYNPQSRLTHLGPFSRDQNLLGATRNVIAEWQALEQAFPGDQAQDLHIVGDVHELMLPRTFGDRFFGERRERAIVFTAEAADGTQRRFLALSEGEQAPVYAAESTALRTETGPAGLFISLPADAGLAALTATLSAMQPEIKSRNTIEHPSEDFTVFGPFARGDREWIAGEITRNAVLAHLIEALDGNRADVSLVSPVILITPPREHGVARALYQPYFGAVMQPFAEANRTSSLGHELVHAFIDEVERQPGQKLSLTADHFEKTHPRLYGRVISELYSELDRRGRAEEAIAEIVGALAAREIRTVDTALGFSRSAAEVAEPIWREDVALLVDFELLPECMDPEHLGYEGREVTFAYYELVEHECA